MICCFLYKNSSVISGRKPPSILTAMENTAPFFPVRCIGQSKVTIRVCVTFVCIAGLYGVLGTDIPCMFFQMTLCFISIYFQLPFCCWSETVQAGCRAFPFRSIRRLLWAGSRTLALQGLLAADAAASFALVCETLPALFEPMALPSDHLCSCYKVSPAAFFLCWSISTNSLIQSDSFALWRELMTKASAKGSACKPW